MATVDELKILIKAETKQLKKELDGVNKKLNKTNEVSKKTNKNLAGAFAKAGVAATALIAVAGKLGTTIAKVGSEFEDLKDSLDTVFGSMEAGDKAMKRVFDFAANTPFQVEDATKAFIALRSVGIEPSNKMLQTFADTASVSLDQLGAFQALVRTVQRASSGGLGLEELNMLDDRGIPALKILQEELGLARDDIARFSKTAQGAKIITDALQEGLEKRFGGAMENKMDNLSTKASNMQIAFKELANEIFEGGLGDLFKGMADGLRELAESITLSLAASRGVGTGVKLITAQTTKGMSRDEVKTARIDAAQANIGLLRGAQASNEESFKRKFEGLFNVMGDDATEFIRQNKLAEEYFQLQNNINDAIQEQIDMRIRLQTGQSLLSEEDKKSIMRQGELQQGFTFITELINKEKGATVDLAFAKANLNEIYAANEEALLRLGFKEEDIIELLKKHKDATADVVTMSEHMQDAIASSAQSFSKEFVDSLLEGGNALDSFKNLAKDIVSQIIATFLQLQIVNKILNSIFGDGPTSGPFDTMSDGKIIKGESAGGGTIQRGAPTLVGERGPEIFVPNTGGTIMNNMNSKNAMGGSPIIVNQSVNFATGVVPTVRAEVTKMLPQISDVTKGAVLEAAMRGGGYRKGLLGA